MRNIKNCNQGKFCIKICLIVFTLLLIDNCCFAQSDLLVNDTRDVNDLPGSPKQKVKFDFKSRNAVNVPGSGNYSGMMTLTPWIDPTGGKNHQLNFNDGGVFYRAGVSGSSSWEGWKKLVMEESNGNVGIGTTTPREKLSVNGNIRAKEVKVETANWPDYVFTKEYILPTLEETEKYIKEKGHLPGIPSATEVKANGIDLGDMNAKLLQKIEELTLHLIELKKQTEVQNKEYRKEIDFLKLKINQMEK